MADPKKLSVIIVVLIAGMLVSSTLAAFYFLRYDQAESDASLYLTELRQATATTVQTTTSTLISGGETTTVTSTVTGTRGFAATTDILIDLGNGTRTWYNGTEVQPGWNVYLATVVITNGDLNDTWYPQYGEHLVNGIDGVQNSQSSSWFLWSYNRTSSWQVAQVGADQLPAYNGSVYAWSYCALTAAYAPVCASP
ncbi:MAG: hypothetical protein OK474_09085 [Thaumarchaeota archaeon]|nr:hypothetical protein [Nitrososphaerota archaeon]